MEPVFVVAIIVASIVAIAVGPAYLRTREKQRLLDTLRVAYERGQPVPPEMIASLQTGEKPRPSPERDLRIGIVLIAIALAMVVLGATIGHVEDEEALWIMSASAAFPGFIGLAFLGFWLSKRGQTADKLER